MPKCPICGAEIDSLKYIAAEIVVAKFSYGGKYNECNYSDFDTIGMAEGTEPNYCCPECDEVLFNREEEAKEFLKNGSLPKHQMPYFVEQKLSR